jgi:hypothetical protein
MYLRSLFLFPSSHSVDDILRISRANLCRPRILRDCRIVHGDPSNDSSPCSIVEFNIDHRPDGSHLPLRNVAYPSSVLRSYPFPTVCLPAIAVIKTSIDSIDGIIKILTSYYLFRARKPFPLPGNVSCIEYPRMSVFSSVDKRLPSINKTPSIIKSSGMWNTHIISLVRI